MTGSIEINDMGEIFTFEVNETTTASEVVDIINGRWPGCARLLSRSISDIDCRKAIDSLQSISNQIKEQKRKQKAIDRIAWEAERRQRYQKGGKWK